MMFQILILVCSIATADCQIDTAIDVIYGPNAANALVCGKYAQAYLAQTSLRHSADQYVKVKCVPLNLAGAR